MDIYIYDAIEQPIARDVARSLSQNPREAVTVHVNSYGGSVSEALAIFNALQTHTGQVTVLVEGVACSAATIIACAARCVAYESALFGFHNPWTETTGPADKHRDAARSLDRFAESVARIYAAKTGKAVDEMTALMAKGETWLSAQEAKTIGFVDEIVSKTATLRLGPHTLPARFSAMQTETPQASIPFMAPEAIARMCENEPIVIAGLLNKPRTEADVRARLDEASEIRAIVRCAGNFEDADGVAMTDSLIRSGASVKTAKQRVLDALVARSERNPIDTTRPVAYGNPVAYGGYGSQFLDAASDALAARMGIVPERGTHPAARDFQDTSLTGMAAMCLNAAGRHTLGVSRTKLVQMAMTTSDFPDLLSGTANKSLATRFEAIAEEHRQFCESANLPDFKPATAVNVSLLPGLLLKPEAAEIQYGALSDGAETYKLATYARGLSLSREAIINDDLQAFSSLIAAAANASARLERDLVFNVLAANAAMSDSVALFHANHGNLAAAADIDVTGLNAARVLMRKQQDSNGGYVMTKPRFIICPVVLEGDAEALVASLTYRPSTDTEISTPNWMKGLTIVSDPRLDAVSATTWYLLSDPTVAPTIRLGYLNGVTAPVVEDDKDFDADLFKYKIRFDVCAAAVGYAGAVKSGT